MIVFTTARKHETSYHLFARVRFHNVFPSSTPLPFVRFRRTESNSTAARVSVLSTFAIARLKPFKGTFAIRQSTFVVHLTFRGGAGTLRFSRTPVVDVLRALENVITTTIRRTKQKQNRARRNRYLFNLTGS